jgi:hypothetical protein
MARHSNSQEGEMTGTSSAIKNGYTAFEFNVLKLLVDWQPTAFNPKGDAIWWRSNATGQELGSEMLIEMDPLLVSLWPPLPEVPWAKIQQLEKPLSGCEIARMREYSTDLLDYIKRLDDWHVNHPAKRNK